MDALVLERKKTQKNSDIIYIQYAQSLKIRLKKRERTTPDTTLIKSPQHPKLNSQY